MRRTLIAGLLGLLLLGATPAAASATTAAPAPDTAFVRVGHLVPGLPAMRMSATLTSFAGGSPLTLTQSASYGTVGDYQELAPGTYSVAVTPADAADDAPPVLTGTVTAEAGDAYTVLGLGSPTSARLQAVPDDISTPGQGTAKVRVINASSVGDVARVSVPGGPTLAASARFSEPSSYTDVPAGDWTLNASADAVTGSTALSVASNTVYTLLVLDDGSGGLELRSVQDASGSGQVPSGGAATGGGWAADTGAPALALGALLVAGSAAGLGVLARRRTLASA